ncbi:hypothetical protein CCH79_00011277 [Gambusia affinis]|uniref:WW domain-containing protein n=1 Tax=Gambusia affinis TaxID=33528 RepID=A0A315V361_GAMAF|nr:hypothetical protein CCH79_00011277 [Gambusia affinis]
MIRFGCCPGRLPTWPISETTTRRENKVVPESVSPPNQTFNHKSVSSASSCLPLLLSAELHRPSLTAYRNYMPDDALRVGFNCTTRYAVQVLGARLVAVCLAHKSQPKSQSSSLHRYTKVRDGSSDPIPPYKVLRRSDESPVSRQGDAIGQHGKAKTSFPVRGKNGTSGSPQEASHNNSSHQGAETHASQSKPAERDPADDWTEHISSSGKKYYYNCRTEVSQWEKPKDLLERQGPASLHVQPEIFLALLWSVTHFT